MANVQPCPCCGAVLGQQQVNRHLARFAPNLTILCQTVDFDSDLNLDSVPGSDLDIDPNLPDNSATGGRGDDLMDTAQDLEDDGLAGTCLRVACVFILAIYELHACLERMQGLVKMNFWDNELPLLGK